MLSGAVLLLLRRMPTDGSWIKKDMRALQSGEPRALRVPLVPADKCSQPTELGIEGFESQVARREVVFFVVKRIVRNVHLAIGAFDRTISIDNRCGVVIKTACSLLEDGRDHHHFLLARHSAHLFRSGTRNGLGQIEQPCVLPLT